MGSVAELATALAMFSNSVAKPPSLMVSLDAGKFVFVVEVANELVVDQVTFNRQPGLSAIAFLADHWLA